MRRSRSLRWRYGWLLLGLAAALLLTAGLQALAIQQDRIVIQTPRKKIEGQTTRVVFEHAAHAGRTPCAACHPPVEPVLNHPGNDMARLHESCKTCHSKTGSAPKVRGCACHTRP